MTGSAHAGLRQMIGAAVAARQDTNWREGGINVSGSTSMAIELGIGVSGAGPSIQFCV
jgi:hypothetical protein